MRPHGMGMWDHGLFEETSYRFTVCHAAYRV